MLKAASAFVLCFMLSLFVMVAAAMVGGCSTNPAVSPIMIGANTLTSNATVPAAPPPPAQTKPAPKPDPEPESPYAPGVPPNCGLPCKAS